MTATSTTEPKTERSTDLEREIQNALDKKRKKRKSVHVMKDMNIKHLRVDSKYIRNVRAITITRSLYYALTTQVILG